MRAFRAVAVFAILLTTLTVSGQDKPPVKLGYIPTLYRDLGLNDEQKKKLYAVQAEFEPKIQAIEKQIRVLKGQEKADMEAVLTDEQKKHIKAIILQKAEDNNKKDEKK
jgi:hypothetical protein